MIIFPYSQWPPKRNSTIPNPRSQTTSRRLELWRVWELNTTLLSLSAKSVCWGSRQSSRLLRGMESGRSILVLVLWIRLWRCEKYLLLPKLISHWVYLTRDFKWLGQLLATSFALGGWYRVPSGVRPVQASTLARPAWTRYTAIDK